MIAFVLVALAAAPADGFRASAWFGERVREEVLSGGVRAIVTLPPTLDPAKPTRLIVYATPNGNTVEQTLGCGPADGQDWHFGIQHVAAQVRRYREQSRGENVALAVIEAEGLSWPAWKRKHADGPARCRQMVETLRNWLPGGASQVVLTGHSGGGSFLFGVLDSADELPAGTDRVVFLDANYSFEDRHGHRLLNWLQSDANRRLVVIAYDDRRITLDGKLVVGPDGGTFRATGRMRTRFVRDVLLTDTTTGDITTTIGLDGRLAFLVHANPQNKILHTALVGEMNGLLRGLTGDGFCGPPTYTKWVQPAPGLPARPADAVGGREFMRRIDKLPLAAREEAIAAELMRGNLPDFLRRFVPVAVGTASIEVMPDYLAVGSDTDFVRVPMTPITAARIADAFGCALPTRKIVDAVYQAATIKLEPKPLTKDREAVATFLQHHNLIESQRAGVTGLVAGIKKDVVVTNRLAERSNRVAIYGWHKLDGSPIQPLTIVHHAGYVDYSHGVRLMRRTVTMGNRPVDVRQVLCRADRAGQLSDEGTISRPSY